MITVHTTVVTVVDGRYILSGAVGAGLTLAGAMFDLRAAISRFSGLAFYPASCIIIETGEVVSL